MSTAKKYYSRTCLAFVYLKFIIDLSSNFKGIILRDIVVFNANYNVEYIKSRKRTITSIWKCKSSRRKIKKLPVKQIFLGYNINFILVIVGKIVQKFLLKEV